MSTGNEDMLQRLNGLFAEWDCTTTPGLVVGVCRNDRLVYRAAFGMSSLEANVRITHNTRFRIASITKQFTALLALVLCEEGLLDLDSPIRMYLPELRSFGADITIRSLLHHRSGIRCSLDVGMLFRGRGPWPSGSTLVTQCKAQGS